MPFIGFNVTPRGREPLEAKIAAIRALKVPKDVSSLRTVLGVCAYYRCFIPNYSMLSAPLNVLLGKSVKWHWGVDEQRAFDDLKSKLCTEGRVLRRVRADRPLKVYVDWSEHGIGGFWGQEDDDGYEYLCVAVSRSLCAAEKSYGSWRGEILGCVYCVKLLRPYLYGRHFNRVRSCTTCQYHVQSEPCGAATAVGIGVVGVPF